MVKTKRITLTALLIMLMSMTVCASFVFADDQSPSIDLKAAVKIEGPAPSPAEEYILKLQSEEMTEPEIITVTGENTGVFQTMEYNKVGVYKYSVWQEAGSNKDCKYDSSVYDVTVYVTNSESGEGLDISAAVYRNGEDDKVPEIIFTNKYKEIKAAKTGDETDLTLYIVLIAVSSLIMLLIGRRQKQ